MTPERWARIKDVFTEALERPEALEELCGGDTELRQEVERLLAEKSGTLQLYRWDAGLRTTPTQPRGADRRRSPPRLRLHLLG